MRGRLQGACASLFLSVLCSAAASGEPALDLALVLAVDVSSSMTADEQELQRLGFVEAFRSPQVHRAIGRGALGRIAVVYMEWSGADEQSVLVPWTLIDGPEAARSFAAGLKRKPLRRLGMTSISGAIGSGIRLFAELGHEPLRRVIDISGDGPNNDGPKVTSMRDRAAAEGIAINGPPIMIGGPASEPDMADLDAYYEDCVIGGPGSFMIPLRHKDQFPTVIQAKILREIAGSGGGSSLVLPAGSRADCLAGEKRRKADEAFGGEGNP